MPSSPVFKYVKNLKFRTERAENIIIRYEKTAHYYSIYFEDGSPIEKTQAYLMCCHIDDNTSIEDNWYNVEELSFQHRCVIAMFRDFIGIDFTEETYNENDMGENSTTSHNFNEY